MIKKTKEYFLKRGFTSDDMYEMFVKYYIHDWSITKISKEYGVASYRVKELVEYYTQRRLEKRKRRHYYEL